MANNGNPGTSSATSNKGRDFDAIKERLGRDAARIKQKDIDRLDTSVPKKLQSKQMQELKENFGWVQEMVDRAKAMFDMVRDKEFKISGKSKTLIAAGLIYLVLPLDLVPDFIPGIGYIDDALVLSTLWKILESQIDSYMAFRVERLSQP